MTRISDCSTTTSSKLYLSHRLWINFESGGAHNASEASMSRGAHSARRGEGVGGGIARCGKNFKNKTLKYAVLGVLLAVCCYFDNLGNALLCKSYYFSTKNYTNRGCSLK